MTLIVTAFSAVIATLVFYFFGSNRKWHLGLLSLMYWGATIMWIVDGCFEVASGEGFLGIEQWLYDAPNHGNAVVDGASASEAFYAGVSDARLGLLVVLCGLIVWLGFVLASDPKGVFKAKKACADASERK